MTLFHTIDPKRTLAALLEASVLHRSFAHRISAAKTPNPIRVLVRCAFLGLCNGRKSRQILDTSIVFEIGCLVA
jgi:hypothetical protein